MKTTTMPPHLLPVHRHLVEWEEAGERRRETFASRFAAQDFQLQLDARGLESRRLKV